MHATTASHVFVAILMEDAARFVLSRCSTHGTARYDVTERCEG